MPGHVMSTTPSSLNSACPDRYDLINHCEGRGKRCQGEYCRNCVPLFCQECGYLGTGRVCLICGYDRGDGDKDMLDATEEDTIFFDEDDGVWRCADCQWEAE